MAAPLNKKKILIIEDDTDIREFLKKEISVYFEVVAEAMMEVLLYILIVIIAFVFAVTTNNTITKEASVIGTLHPF